MTATAIAARATRPPGRTPAARPPDWRTCGSISTGAPAFITTPSPEAPNPKNITIQNSVFGDHGGSYNLDGGAGRACEGWTFAYNTFSKERLITCAEGSAVAWIGNLGPKSPNQATCTPGTAWTRNVWQWSSDAASCAGNTDTWVEGPNFSTSELGLDGEGRLLAGSPAIDAGESAYCGDALGATDRDGDARPAGAGCDAGADERLDR